MANFYDTTGAMVGLDRHKYWAVTPATGPVPVPMTAWYLTLAQYWINSADEEQTKTARVTSDGKRMIQGKCKLVYLFHWPVVVPAPPHPAAEAVELLITIACSSTVPVFRRQSVTGQGEPLAICCAAMFGVNLDCGDPVKMPTGLVINVNSVKTGVSPADVVPAVVDWLVDTLVSQIVKGLFKKLLDDRIKKWIEDRIVRRLVEKIAQELTKQPVKTLVKKGKDAAQKILRKLGVPFV